MKDKKRQRGSISEAGPKLRTQRSTLKTRRSNPSSTPVPIVEVGESGGNEEASAQERVTEELHKSDARFLNLADTDPAMLWITEPEGSCSFRSRGWYRFTGQTEQEALGKAGFGWLDAVHPEDREQVGRMFLEANEKRRSFSLDYRLRRHDGEYRWAIDAGNPHFEPTGEFLGYIGSVLDITERKRVEQRLRRSEQELADFFENATVGLHWVGPDGIILRANRAELNLLGYVADEYVGHNIAKFHADQGVLGDILMKLAAGEELHNYEAQLRCKDGSVRHVLMSSNVLCEDGRFIHTRCFTRDITERKQAEALLAAEKKVLELIATGAAMPEVLDTLMRETEAQSTDGMLCSVLLADEKGQRLLHGAAPNLTEAYNAAIHGIVIGPSVGSCGTAAFERKPVFVNDIATDPRWADFKDLAAAHGLGACCSTPILSGQDELLGTVAMYYRQPHNPSQADRKLIERAAQLAGIAIERHRTEKALRESEERQRLALSAGKFGSWQLDLATMELQSSKQCKGDFGRAPEAPFTYEMFRASIHPEDRPTVEQRVAEAMTQCGDFEADCRCIWPDGSVHWINAIGHAIGENGRAARMVGVTRDITERRRIFDDLRRSETFIASVVENLPFMIFVKEARDLTFVRFNKAGEDLLGHSREALIGKSDYDVLPKEQADFFTDNDRQVLQTGGLLDIPEEVIETKHQGLRILHTKKIPLYDDTGEPRYLVGISEDITERKRTEDKLKESENRYRSIFEKAVHGIFQTTADGKYVAVNPALARIYGYDSPDNMIAAITDIARQLYVDPGRRDEFLRAMQAQKEVTGFESLVYRKDGGFMWISESARTLRDQAGTVVGYEGTVEDITERKRVEGRLRATLDHVRTLSGRLTTVQEEERARIARELHDELGVKLTCLKIDLSRMTSLVGHRVRADLRAKLNDRVCSMVGQVDGTIAAVQRLVTQLRPALLDNLGLVAAIEWQSRDFQERTGIPCTCATNADDIAMEPEQATAVLRICQEALTNTARHAQATAVMIQLFSQPDSLQMMVTDNGVGIPNTKASDRRSLGLLGMQERAAQCGGTLTIEGDPEKGTTVTLCMPVRGDSLNHKKEPC